MLARFKPKCCRYINDIPLVILSGLLLAGSSLCRQVMAEEYDMKVAAALGHDVPEHRETVAPFEEALLEIHLNGQDLKETALVLVRADRRVLVRVNDLQRWRLRMPEAAITTYRNDAYILLDDLGSVTYRVEAATQSLLIDARPENFLSSTFAARHHAPASPHMPSAGGFLNYDVSAQRYQGTDTVGTQLELGIFGGGWVGTTQVLNRDLDANGHFIRLESTLTMDRPEHRASLRLGDAISRSGAWGRAVRFGGIQWSTNFATQPDFITFPLPSLSGSAALPSTAEVFVNNVRSYQGDIQPGPFSLNEVPVVTGQGEVRMVVRDLLGREQVIVQPFYAARSLLKSGLDDYSYELGTVRENFGTAGNDYGHWLLAGTRRHGFTDRFTGEVHGELAPARQTLGVAATTLFHNIGVVDTAIAGSHSDAGGGGLLGVGFDRQTSSVGFGLRTQVTSRRFGQLGLAPGQQAPLRQSSAHIGWNYANIGSFGLGYVRLDNRGQPGNEVISANYNRGLGHDWFFGISAFKNLREPQEYAVGMVLTHALDSRRSTSMTVNTRNNGDDSLLFQLQQNLPAGSGTGYRLLAGSEGSERFEGSLSMQNDYGRYTVEASRFRDAEAYRASVSGGMAVLGGHAFLARRLGDSFAVVRVPDYPNVRVYAENQPVARTGKSGAALVPGLRPYQKNHLRIEQNDLPLDARIDALEVDAVPYYRSGYDVEFPVRKANGARLRIITKDGKAVPAGATVRINGRDKPFAVALDGQTYLTGLERNNRLAVKLPDDRTCELDVSYPETGEPLPDLGSLVCMEARP